MNILDIDSITSADSEITNTIINSSNVKIEQIISTGQNSPDNFWYDQDQNEWVIVLSGSGTIEYSDNSTITLNPGDSLLIPAHVKHRVQHTDNPTIWLAVFYN